MPSVFGCVWINPVWCAPIAEREEEERLEREEQERIEEEYKQKLKKLEEIEAKKRERERQVEERLTKQREEESRQRWGSGHMIITWRQSTLARVCIISVIIK